jgi:hypothetical protein
MSVNKKTTRSAGMSDAPKAPTTQETEDIFAEMDLAVSKDLAAPAAPADQTAPAAEPKKRGRKPKVKVESEVKAEAEPKPKKAKEEVVLNPREKAIRKMMRRAGITELPTVDNLVRGKLGQTVKVSDIAVFISTPKEEPFKALAKEWPLRNRVNLSAEVNLDHCIKLGADILSKGRLLQPITVAKVEDGVLECTSGRHRLAFFALVYGPQVALPVYVEEMDLNTARDTVVVSNQTRPTKAMERAEHAVLSAVSGNADAKPDELYEKLVVSKLKARKYCVYSVLERKHPCKLGFLVSLTSSRKDGGLTTVSNVEGFWGAAVKWVSSTGRKDFDAALKAATEFLNEMAETMQKTKEFEPKQHLAAQTMIAIGKYYLDYLNVKGEVPASLAGKVAKAVIAMGDIGRQKSEKTYAALSKAMQK